VTSWATQIDAITLFVEDPAASAEFYQRVFELEPKFGDANGTAFMLGEQFFFLTAAKSAPDMIAPLTAGEPGHGPRHVFAIIVPDVDAVGADLRAKGVTLINGPEDRSWGMRTLNFADPDGYVWEIATEMTAAD
jgi:lactoylglutathione lyase